MVPENKPTASGELAKTTSSNRQDKLDIMRDRSDPLEVGPVPDEFLSHHEICSFQT
jgi:hypothetical protein